VGIVGKKLQKIIRTGNAGEIELQMNTIFKFKYYGHHIMSRGFKQY
jgi:hypothetical protein